MSRLEVLQSNRKGIDSPRVEGMLDPRHIKSRSHEQLSWPSSTATRAPSSSLPSLPPVATAKRNPAKAKRGVGYSHLYKRMLNYHRAANAFGTTAEAVPDEYLN